MKLKLIQMIDVLHNSHNIEIPDRRLLLGYSEDGLLNQSNYDYVKL